MSKRTLTFIKLLCLAKDQSSPWIYSRPTHTPPCMFYDTGPQHSSTYTPPKLLHTQFEKMSLLATYLDAVQWEIATEAAKCLHWIMGQWQSTSPLATLWITLDWGRFIYTIRFWGRTAWFTRWLCSPPVMWPQGSYVTSRESWDLSEPLRCVLLCKVRSTSF